MKKFIALFMCCLLILMGCTPEDTADTVPPTTLASVVPDTTDDGDNDAELLAVSVPASSEQFALEDGTVLFTYTAQHMQLILPNDDIADKVILDFLNRVDTSRPEAESILTAAQNDYDPALTWFPYFHQVIYSPTRIDHGVLSLFGTQNSYSGGIHGSLSCVAANYDLTTGDVLTLGSIMHMDADKEDFINIILEKLEGLSEEYYLFDNYEEGVRSRLEGDENLYEDFYFTMTGLSFFFSPYEIAPYASGIISVEIPYSELPGLIYDGYFPAERERVQGTMHTGPFMETDMEQFNSMAEVTLATDEEIIVAYPEGKVEDIRITIPGDGMNIPDYTVFAALEMSNKDAVVISIAQEDIAGVSIAFTADGKAESIPLTQ